MLFKSEKIIYKTQKCKARCGPSLLPVHEQSSLQNSFPLEVTGLRLPVFTTSGNNLRVKKATVLIIDTDFTAVTIYLRLSASSTKLEFL